MSLQNSIYATTPIAVNKGGTANTGTLANGQLWVGNGTATPAIANLTGANGIAVTNGSGSITVGQATTLTNGQLWVGNTGNVPTAATVTAGTNISVTNGAGSIAVGTTGLASFTWTFNVSGSPTNFQMAAGFHGYESRQSGINFVMPTNPNIGDMYSLQLNFNSTPGTGFTITANIGQNFEYNGVTGPNQLLTTTNANAAITLLCVAGGFNGTFTVLSTNGAVFVLT